MNEESQVNNSLNEQSKANIFIYERIYIAYNKSGLKKKEFAKKADISASYVTYLLSNTPKDGVPSDRALKSIAAALGVTFQWLKYENGDMHDRKGLLSTTTGTVNEARRSAYGDARLMKLIDKLGKIYKHGTLDERAKVFGIISAVMQQIEDREKNGKNGE